MLINYSKIRFKYIFVSLIFISFSGNSQGINEKLLKGKELFLEAESDNDVEKYNQSIKIFKSILSTDTNNTEAKYFLGYSLSRLNRVTLEQIPNLRIDLTRKASKEFEEIIGSSEKFFGDFPFADPHSKIMIEWGELAVKYQTLNMPDSLKWALNESKSRGCFSDYLLKTNKLILENCPKNSILFVNGENFFFPMQYLQLAENFRKDIVIIRTELLETSWYPKYLIKNNIVHFKSNLETIDNIFYQRWTEKEIHIGKLNWILKPTFEDKFILRKDLLLLEILERNNFSKPILFTNATNDNQILFLKEYLKIGVATKTLMPNKSFIFEKEKYIQEIKSYMSLSKTLNRSNLGEMNLFDVLRMEIIYKIYLLSLYPENKTIIEDLKAQFLETKVWPEIEFQLSDATEYAKKILLN